MTKRIDKCSGPSPLEDSFELKASYTGSKAILDLTQGVLDFPPPTNAMECIVRKVREPSIAAYSSRRGVPRLRELVADDAAELYSSKFSASNILITAGCNQACCIALSSILEPGDEVITTDPYYFNYESWIRLCCGRTRHTFLSSDGELDIKSIESNINHKTKAILLVSPSNPLGVQIQSRDLESVAEIAKAHGLLLFLDETYRFLRGSLSKPHHIFDDPEWMSYFVSFFSFSKEFAMPGYRVGGLISSPEFLNKVLRLLDCVAICPSRIGQELAIACLQQAKERRREMAQEVSLRRKQFNSLFESNPGGFRGKSLGALFSWIEHPNSHIGAQETVESLLKNQGVLALPGSIFSMNGERFLRFSLGHLSVDRISELAVRLSEIG